MSKPVIRNRHDRRAAKAPVEADPAEPVETAATYMAEVALTLGGTAEIPLHLIDGDPDLNPRTRFSEEELAELAASIGDKGVLQPILVRPSTVEGRFRTVAGERRRRAALLAGLLTIPAMVRELADDAAFEVATIENVQRQDMNPMEEARAFDRIITDRMAADPDLALKDAKAAVADVVRRSVRFVELRLQLMALPVDQQAKVEDGSLAPREAIQWLRNRPKPLELTPRQWLIALEVFDRQERFPAPKKYDYESAATECRAEADGDVDVQVLAYPAQLISGASEVYDDGRTGRFTIRFRDYNLHHLQEKFGAVEHEDVCQAALCKIRTQAGVEFPLALKAGEYATPWLNGPFDPSPELLAEIAAEREDRAQRHAAQAVREEEHKAQVVAQRAAGQLRLEIVTQLAATVALAPPAQPLLPGADVLLADGGKPLPWYPTARAGILAANGEIVLGDWDHQDPHPDTVARVHLMAVAVNAAAGLATPDTPPAKAEGEELDADMAADDDADPFGEADHEDEDEAETEDDGELEAAAGDEDVPLYLRRLAGAAPAGDAAHT